MSNKELIKQLKDKARETQNQLTKLLLYKASYEVKAEKRGERNAYLEAIILAKKLEQPQLNENQQALVMWMQENERYSGNPLESISDLFLEATPSEHFPNLPLSCVAAAYQSLTNRQKAKMVSEYLRQYLEQGEE